jgi:uncharacterized protein YhfF
MLSGRLLSRHAGLDHEKEGHGQLRPSASLTASPPSLARDYGADREPIPKPGDFVMMLDGQGHPRFIWRTTEVAIKRRTRRLRWDEGEGESTREWWLDAHRLYFARQSRPEGFELDHEILTVFERSEGVWPLDVSTPAAYKVNIYIMTTNY